ncbi:MAG: cyclic nucleotide-binding domain-containing protein [Acidobacteriota bacterium]|nr:cyclic nucleotide-binding domain-containing protein [Acidobacteriota bacterium]
MMKHELHEILRQHDFFKDLPEDDLLVISGCAKMVMIKAGEVLAREGSDANNFYVVRMGKLRIEQQAPAMKPQPIQTIGCGDVAGWSWLFPPYRWSFDVIALEDSRLICLDGACLRGKCENNHSLGYRVVKKFADVLRQRLHAASLQAMDVYAPRED